MPRIEDIAFFSERLKSVLQDIKPQAEVWEGIISIVKRRYK
jgi:hypothetical protein